MQKRYALYLFFLSVLLVAVNGCIKSTGSNAIETSRNVDISAAISGMQQEYRISPQDILRISVYQEEDMEKDVRVSQDGYITYPFVGKLKIDGLTVIELEEKLAAILGKDYFVNPQITVFVKSYHRRRVYVMGQVKSPGSYDFLPERPMSVVEAISIAGGFTDLAAQNGTKIIRVEDGIEKTITVKISDITKKGDKSKDVILKPNDIVVVPEKIF